jgi:hypothetical protein
VSFETLLDDTAGPTRRSRSIDQTAEHRSRPGVAIRIDWTIEFSVDRPCPSEAVTISTRLLPWFVALHDIGSRPVRVEGFDHRPLAIDAGTSHGGPVAASPNHRQPAAGAESLLIRLQLARSRLAARALGLARSGRGQPPRVAFEASITSRAGAREGPE